MVVADAVLVAVAVDADDVVVAVAVGGDADENCFESDAVELDLMTG